MSDDDALIMQAVQAGDFEPFEILVNRYWSALQQVALSKLGDPTAAEDVVQETFLAVFASRHTYKPEFAFRTWLWTILLNRCRKISARKKNRPKQIPRSQVTAKPSAVLRNDPVESETGLSHLLREERRTQLMQLLNELPEPQGDALRLRFFGNLKFSEIAEAMNSSVSGAKRRVKNGLLALSARLTQETTEEPTTRTMPTREPHSQGKTP